ncbi:MAG: hypothetical protein LQ340_001446 [Diploschistes diacapsis]|nr:MAG: hypothetical protein LQ340_001446 [Diploschistes diacapsis]
MRLSRPLMRAFLFFYLKYTITLASGNQLPPDGGSITLSAASVSSSSSASSIGSASPSSRHSIEFAESSLSTASASLFAATTASVSARVTAVTTSASAVNTNTTEAMGSNDGSLPLPPEITPGLSLAGAFLILSGVTYNLIGVKNQATQIFISTAYLIALAITVLLVYVVNPPISDAVQAAYFVAAFLPAVGLGGVSLVFKDITEGLGCASGGFALSMWFLVLKPGGTLTNTVSKAIFISCFTAGTYMLYFSHHIRSYVIIGATSFSGATAIILGIDCFALAGLKEFWVYIWGLNAKLFPEQQDTYPITRGMTVEIAGIVVLTFFGILSQLRIWKIVQARREKEEMDRSDNERQRDEEEAELGRRLQAGQERERREWERIYGDKKKSSVFSTEVANDEKRSTSIGARGVGEQIEMARASPIPSAASTSRRASASGTSVRQIIVPVAVDDDITPVVSDESRNQSPFWTIPSTLTASPNSSVDELATNKAKETKTRGPELVPLPFTITATGTERRSEDSCSGLSLANTKHSSEGSPGKQHMPPLSRKVFNHVKNPSETTLTSLEAQVGESVSSAQRSAFLTHSAVERETTENTYLKDAGANPLTTRMNTEVDGDPTTLSQTSAAAAVGGNTVGDSQSWPLRSEKKSVEETKVPDRMSSEPSAVPIDAQMEEHKLPTPPHHSSEPSSPRSTASRGCMDKHEAPGNGIEGHLQHALSEDTMSKVVLQFRTNEWAKHLEAAERPGPDVFASSESPTEEPISVVNEEELLKTPLTAQPATAPLAPRQRTAPANPKNSQSSPDLEERRAYARIPSPGVQDTLAAQRPDVPRNDSSSSRQALKRSSMNSESKRQSLRSPFPPFQPSRNSLVTSPIAEDAVASFPLKKCFEPTISSGPHGTSMPSRRSVTDPSPSFTQHMLQNQTSPQPTSPNAGTTAALPNENLPLSQRKFYLRQSTSGNLSSRTPAHPSVSEKTSYQQIYPPSQSQPQQTIPEHTLRRASMLADWRRNKASDGHGAGFRNTPPPFSPNAIPAFQPPDRGPAALNRNSSYENGATGGGWTQVGGTGLNAEMNVRDRAGKGVVDSAVHSGRRLSRRVSGMSAREVDNAHKEVLRRMQAGANKALARDDR